MQQPAEIEISKGSVFLHTYIKSRYIPRKMVSTAPTNKLEGDWTFGSVRGQFGFKDGGQIILPASVV